MSVVLCILFAVLGAAAGAFMPEDLDDESVGLKRGPAIQGGVVGAAWGGLAGIHLGGIISLGDLIEALPLILWPILILAALASLGILVRLLSRPRASEPAVGAIANWSRKLAAMLGFAMILISLVCVMIVIPAALPSPDPSFRNLPMSVQGEMVARLGLTMVGAFAGFFLLTRALRSEFATMMIGASLGQFAGGLAGALLVGHESFPMAARSGFAAAAGGLCTSFEGGLAGAILGASIGALLMIVWLLSPGIGEAWDALPGKDDQASGFVEMRGVAFARAFSSFGKLADEEGPFHVAAGIAAMLALLGALFGFVFGPVFGEDVLRSLALLA